MTAPSAATQQTEKEKVADLAEFLGEGIHTAFRKAVDSVEAHKVWTSISALPDGDWGAVLDFVAAEVLAYARQLDGRSS